MGNMIYDGVELPDVESVWTDKETYPYVFIFLLGPNYTATLLNTTYYVNASGSRMYWSGDGHAEVYNAAINTVTGEIAPWKFDYSFEYSQGEWNSGPAVTPIIWNNFDVHDVNGVLYSYASPDPVDPNAPTEPTYTYDRTAFLSGLAAGLTGKGEPTFTTSDTFGKGYLAGAALRRRRVT